MNRKISLLVVGLGLLMLATPALAQEEVDHTAELAQQLSNPVANLISVPFEYNMDFGIGPANAQRSLLNIQPVIPIALNKEFNLITRTIFPLIYAEAPAAGRSDASGLGDIVQSFFVSPTDLVGGWIVGAGPVLLYPSATENTLGNGKWGAGPTVVLLKQQNGWTYGLLANHIWSYAGESNRNDIDASFLQPFVAYQTSTFTTFGANSESTYDWKGNQWLVPVNVSVSQMLKIGGMPISLRLGGRVYAEKPAGGPDWGLRFGVTFLFPK